MLDAKVATACQQDLDDLELQEESPLGRAERPKNTIDFFEDDRSLT